MSSPSSINKSPSSSSQAQPPIATSQASMHTAKTQSAPRASLLQRVWQGFCAFVAYLCCGASSGRSQNGDARGPTEPYRALKKPDAMRLGKLGNKAYDAAFPFAQYPLVDTAPAFADRTPRVLRCGNVAYKLAWHKNESGTDHIDFTAEPERKDNRALFVAHTQKLLTKGGMQASRAHLHAASELYQTNIRIWSRDLRSAAPWTLCETVEPPQGPAGRTVDLCLYMQAGDASHYRVLTNVNAMERAEGVTEAEGARVVEAGAEGECLYLALAWALDKGATRGIRADFDALRELGRAPQSFVAYFKSRSSLLTEMHEALGQALCAPEHAERIDAEVQDAVEMQWRREAKRHKLA